MIIILSVEEKEKIENYILKTHLLRYVFCTDLNSALKQSEVKYQKDNILYSDKFLSMLSELVRENKETEILGSEAKYNVYRILVYIKSNDSIHTLEEKSNRIDISNKIIRNLNCTYGESNYYKFVIAELHKREFNPFLFAKDPDIYDTVVFMNAYSYDIMIWNALNSSPEEYMKFAKTMVGNKDFFTTIAKFVNDMPEMFKDEKICDRVSYVIDQNRRNNIVLTSIKDPKFVRDNSSINKKLVKLKEAYKKF